MLINIRYLRLPCRPKLIYHYIFHEIRRRRRRTPTEYILIRQRYSNNNDNPGEPAGKPTPGAAEGAPACMERRTLNI